VTDTLAFSTFDVRSNSRAPQVCSLCTCELRLLRYEMRSDESGFQPFEGYCCARCGTNLLVALEKMQAANHAHGGSDPSGTP
jgi:hypothetical protein